MSDHEHNEHNGEESSTPPHTIPVFPGGTSTDFPDMTHREVLMLQHISRMMQSGFEQQRLENDRRIDQRIAFRTVDTPLTAHVSGGDTGRHSGDTSHMEKSDKVTFKSFKANGATEFTGIIDPVKAFDWIKNTEKVFRISHCRETDKAVYASAMLTGDALDWWDGIFEAMPAEQQQTLSWPTFKEKFQRQYCPTDLQDRYAREFLDLRQGSMSVTAYLSEFHRKSKFAAEYIPNEERKVKRFVEGLQIDIREHLDGHLISTLEEAAEQARRREHILSIKKAESMPPPKRGRSDFSSNPSSFSRPTFFGRSFSGSSSNARSHPVRL